VKPEARLPAILRGEDRPGLARDGLTLAGMCVRKEMHAAAARLSVQAFADVKRLADDLSAQHRYNAACSAALAAAGKGEDAAKLGQKDRRALRRHALTWLRADLAARQKQLKGLRGPEARAALALWQKDAGLAGLRDEAALAKLPAEERAACERLWADVAALLEEAETPAKKEGRP
jgi:hypothetical protein